MTEKTEINSRAGVDAELSALTPNTTAQGGFFSNAWNNIKSIGEPATLSFAQQQQYAAGLKAYNLANPDTPMDLDGYSARMQEGQGMTGMDMFGAAMGVGQMGLNYMNQRDRLDQGQQALNLSKDKFAFLKSNQADIRAASEENLARSNAQQVKA